MKFTKMEIYYARHNSFTIEINHWKAEVGGIIPYDPTNCWTLYANIFPNHPFYDKLKTVDTDRYSYSDIICGMPLHCGCSFFDKRSANSSELIRVGCDYRHLHDDRFGIMTSLEDAWEVVKDAEYLFKYLEERYDHQNKAVV